MQLDPEFWYEYLEVLMTVQKVPGFRCEILICNQVLFQAYCVEFPAEKHMCKF